MLFLAGCLFVCLIMFVFVCLFMCLFVFSLNICLFFCLFVYFLANFSNVMLSTRMQSQDHYAVLGLEKVRFNAADDDIKKACQSQLLLHHKTV